MIADLLPDDEQRQIVDSLSRTLDRALPLDRFHRPSHAGDLVAWSLLAEAGLFGLGVASDGGGVGYGWAEEVLAAIGLGRRLVTLDVIATMSACHLAAAAGDHALLERLMTGEKRAAFATDLAGHPAQGIALTKDEAVCFVWLGEGAALLSQASVTLADPIVGVDEIVPQRLARVLSPAAMSQALGRHADLLIAAYLAGVAEGAMVLATEYAKVREQFGQPIGAFQAVKHSCADMAVAAEACRAQVCYAAVAGPEAAGIDREIAAARFLAARAARHNSTACIQVHGAMGVTYEGLSHYFLKRALLLSTFGTTPRRDLAKILAA